MVSSVLLLFGAVVAWAAYNIISGLRSNIDKARKTNLPYIIVRKLYPPGGVRGERTKELGTAHMSAVYSDTSTQSTMAAHMLLLGAYLQEAPENAVG